MIGGIELDRARRRRDRHTAHRAAPFDSMYVVVWGSFLDVNENRKKSFGLTRSNEETIGEKISSMKITKHHLFITSFLNYSAIVVANDAILDTETIRFENHYGF